MNIFYEWFIPHRIHNRLIRILHGNTATPTTLPTLSEDANRGLQTLIHRRDEGHVSPARELSDIEVTSAPQTPRNSSIRLQDCLN